MDKMKIVLVALLFLITISPSSAMFEVTKYWSNVVTVGDEAKIACRLEALLTSFFLVILEKRKKVDKLCSS